MGVEISLCPSLSVRAGASAVAEDDLHGRQGRTVLALLILERSLTRDELADQLWPSGLPRSWGDSLNAILSRLRKALREVAPDMLVTSKGHVDLRLPAGSSVDVEAAAASVIAAESSLRDGDHRAALASASAAWAVLQHDLLAADPSPMIEGHRARLAALRLRTLEARAGAHLAAGAWQAAIDEAERTVAADPFREGAWRLLMTAHLRAGNTAGALTSWERLRRLLADELGVEPSPESQALYLELLHHEPAESSGVDHGDVASLIASASAEIGGPDEVGALRRLDDVYAQVRSALRAALDATTDTGAALRLAVDLSPYWNIRGWWSEGRTWLQRALDSAPATHPARPAALRALGDLAWRMGDLDAAEHALQAALATADRDVAPAAMTSLAAVALGRGDADRATELFEQVLDSASDDAVAGRCHLGLGVIAARRSRFDDAVSAFGRALSAHRRVGDMRNVAQCLSNLSSAIGSQGSVVEARAYAEEALAIRRTLGDSAGIAMSLTNLGILLKSAGETERAIERLEASLSLRRQIGERAGIVGSLNALGDAVRASGDDRTALDLYREAITIARAIPDPERLCLTLLSAANVHVALSRAAEAAPFIDEATALADTLGSATLRAAALEASAAMAAAQGDRPAARILLSEADEIRERIGAPLAPGDRLDIERTRDLIAR